VKYIDSCNELLMVIFFIESCIADSYYPEWAWVWTFCIKNTLMHKIFKRTEYISRAITSNLMQILIVTRANILGISNFLDVNFLMMLIPFFTTPPSPSLTHTTGQEKAKDEKFVASFWLWPRAIWSSML